MTWRLDWQRYNDRLESLEHATLAVLRAQSISADDPHQVISRLITEWRAVARDMREFKDSHAATIPGPAFVQLESLASEQLLQDSISYGVATLSACLAIFAAFRSRFAFHVAEKESRIANVTERAFVHLQQLIVVDQSARDRWIAAFEKRETACEALGAAHLLLHGVWSFKAHGAGAYTDLVLQEPALDVAIVERAAAALVLTEWKKVGDSKSAGNIAADARKQAALYGAGVLSAIQLTRQRYIVLVSKDRLSPIPDSVEDGVVYRHVNVAVEPSTPSRAT